MSDGTMTLMDMAHAERKDIVDLLKTLGAAQWQAPSLCAGWTVKDVVAHMISYDYLGTLGLIGRFAKGRLVHANQVGVDELAGLSTQQLVDLFDQHVYPRGLTAGFGGMIALVDGTIHHQDIRRTLDLPRVIPYERLQRLLPLMPGNPRLRAGRRIRGLRLSATDVDWQHGRGPEVRGTGEALMMAMAGRPSVVGELSGLGVPILAERLN
jgi:uncharacterized protein (TIGR03083 family)